MNRCTMNPILPPAWHIPDAEAHVFDGELYLYGSCDKTREHYCSEEYYVVHTKDFCHWQIEGPSFRTSDVPWRNTSKHHSSVSSVTCFDELPQHIKAFLPESARQVPIEQIVRAIEENAAQNAPKESLLYAPDAARKDGRTYLYFCMSDDSEGVAVSDSPVGPFSDAVQLKTDKTHTALSGIDPAVFVDEDGQVYYYWGQFGAKCARLMPDMITIDEDSIVENVLTEETHHFHEGSSMRKRGGIYYYVFADSSRGKPTCLGYATGTSPLGPFVYRGVIIDNAKCDPKSWNNHGSIEEVNGQWYVFYHKSCGNSEYGRRTCMEPIEFDEQGLIAEVKPTSQGGGTPFDLEEQIPAYTACEVDGGAYVSDADEGNALVFPHGDGKAVFRYLRCDKTSRELRLFGEGNAHIEILADGVLVGWGRMEDEVIPVTLKPGIYELELVFRETRNLKVNAVSLW